MATDYTQLMEALRHGERDSFTVTPDEFMAFHDAYIVNESLVRRT